MQYNNAIFKYIIGIIFFLLLFNKAYAKNEFEIAGFKLGMLLSDKLTAEEIKRGQTRNFYNTKYIKVQEFEKSSYFTEYDYTQFAFKKKSKKEKIIAIDGVKHYANNIWECFFKKDEIVDSIKKKYKKKIDYFDDIGTRKLTSQKGTQTTIWIIFKDKTYIYVSCYNYDPSSSSVDALRIGISNKYFDKYAFKK